MKQWHFFDKVYRRWVVLMICELKDFQHELELCGFNDMDSIVEAKGMCVELTPQNTTTKQYCTMIWLNGYETATLVHEISHLVMMCFDQVGIPISRENTEAFAFYSEYWFNEIQRAKRKYPDGKSPTLARKGL